MVKGKHGNHGYSEHGKCQKPLAENHYQFLKIIVDYYQ
jgi:hypothetical protein